MSETKVVRPTLKSKNKELFDAYWDSGKFGGNWWYDEDTLAEAIYMLTLEITCLGDINLIEQTQKTEQKCNKKAEEEQQKRKQAIESYGTPIENPVWSGAYGMSGRFLPDNRMILLQYLANASKNGYYNEDMLAQLENNLGVVGIDFSTKNYTIDEECMYGLIERYMQYPESNKVIGKFLDNGGGLIVMGVLTLGVGCLAAMEPQTGRASKNAEALEKEVEAEAEVKVEEKVAAESEGVSGSGSAIPDSVDIRLNSLVDEIRTDIGKEYPVGNVGAAITDIEGVTSEIKAYSKINNSISSPNINHEYSYNLGSNNRIFETVDVNSENIVNGPKAFNRCIDTESKILEDIAHQLGYNTFSVDESVVGNVYLITERAPCPSCESVIAQFKEMFPNVNVEVKYMY